MNSHYYPQKVSRCLVLALGGPLREYQERVLRATIAVVIGVMMKKNNGKRVVKC